MAHLYINYSSHWARLYHALMYCFVFFIFCSGQANATQVSIVLSKDSKSYLRFVKSVEAVFENNDTSGLSYSVIKLEDYSLSSKEKNDAASFIVPVGSKACHDVIKIKPDVPVLCTLISRNSFEKILKKENTRFWSKLSAQYINQPSERLFALIRVALPDTKNVGIIRSGAARYRLKAIRKEATNVELNLSSTTFSESDELVSVLNNVLEKNQVLLGLPDPEVLNSRTVQSLLLTSYLQHVPVVAYSLPYVRAGALMTVHSTPEQLGKQLADTVIFLNKANSWSLGKPELPKDFSVAVNKRVADSLDIDLPSENKLKDRVLKQLGGSR